MATIKVLCVDDSSLIRSLMTRIVEQQPDMQMVATAANALIARDLIKQFNPDVLTLDVEMPHMDGLEFLDRLMRLRPMPVIMVSSLTTKGSETTLTALDLGAVDFIAKPEFHHAEGIALYAASLCEKIRAAALVKLQRTERSSAVPAIASTARLAEDALLAIGSSTGGTEALRRVLTTLPANCPGIVIAQHMPPGFTRSFAERLNLLCQITVKEAQDGEPILPGCAYIAPGDYHLTIARRHGHYHVVLNQAPAINRHRPSVDALFTSVAHVAGKKAVGAILTGMGADGAAGLLAMRQSGAWTLAQSEKTCVVFGMPREAIEIGAACEIADLTHIGQLMLNRAGAKAHVR